MGTHPEVSRRVATLLKRQNGWCARCGLYFGTAGELPEVDHIVPKHLGRIDAYFNLQLVHRHCHDHKTAKDSSLTGPDSLGFALPELIKGTLQTVAGALHWVA